MLVYALESARIERAVNDQIDQEIAEFRELRIGIDPLTGEPFDDVGSLLDVFLTRNVPDDDEMLVGYAPGAPPARTRNRYGQEVLDEPAYQQAVADLSESGGTTVIASQRFGEVWVTVVPVRNSGTSGSLVIVNFLADEHTELNRTLRTYALVALMSLGLITTIAAFQSGRLLAPLRTLEETARDITATDLSRRIPEQGNDDITALTRTINLMLERLDAGFTDQRRFLDDAGHELKTPLTVMRGHLELLDPADAAEVAETRELLLDEADRMSRLVGDLIVLAKTRRPDFLSVEPVALEPFTHTLLAKARGLGDRDWQLDASARGTFTVDEQRITQAVLQLADNAVKHTDPGDTVAIGSSIADGTTTIWVRDTGRGVAIAQREAIFERFGRGNVRAGRRGVRPGAVHRPRHRRGPRRQGVGHRRPAAWRTFRADAASRGGPRTMAQILIVEDEGRIASFVAKGLRAEGHKPTVVGDGIAGLEEALSGRFDLLVLDIGLPGMDGFQLLDQLRAQGSRMPVIVLTARDSVTDTVTALDSGADDYMPKPFRFAELMARVRLRLRQSAGGDTTAHEELLSVGNVELNRRTRRILVGGRELDLSAREFAMAEIFMLNPGQVLSREQLLDHVWGYDFDPGSNVVDVYVGYLRKKVGSEAIETVRGVGYRFNSSGRAELSPGP